MSLTHIAALLGAVATGAGLAAGAGALLVRLARAARRVVHLVDDLTGEPERPGVEARPGLMERVSGIEDRLGAVEHEVRHNNGSSLKDAVKRTETAVSELADRVNSVEEGGDA